MRSQSPSADTLRMEAFDHDKPANRDEWVFVFAEACRALRSENGEKYAKVHFQTLRPVQGPAACDEWRQVADST